MTIDGGRMIKRYLIFGCGIIMLISAAILWFDWYVDNGSINLPIIITIIGVFFTALGVKIIKDR